jgi:CHAD domain-containing protein
VAGARKVRLDCDASFSKAAKKTVKVRAAEVFAHSEGVLDLGDVERVHDMRVATRRLRAALEVFEPSFPAKRHRKALKKVRKLATALGERRDADVEIALLESLADEAAEADRAALHTLIDELRLRQAEANEALAPYVAPKRLKKLRRRLKKLVKKAGSG